MLAAAAVGIALVVSGLWIGPGSPLGQTASRPDVVGTAATVLFSPVADELAPILPAGSQTPSRRERMVRLVVPALDTARVGGGAMVLNLFDDVRLPIEIVRDEAVDGSRLLLCRVVGEPESQVLLVTRAGEVGTVLQADVRTQRRGAFEVRFVGPDTRGGAGVHVVRELNESGYKPCGTGGEHHVHAPGAPGATEPLRGALTRIDVMIVYTPQAQTGAGGQTAIEALCDLAVSQANQVYLNSGIGVQLRLVYRGLVNYPESGSASQDLGALRSTTDGVIDEVHCIRNIVGADMVAMLVNSFNACGIGYLMVNVNGGFASSAFSVTDKDCIGGYTFAHELGHNMGCNHDRDNAGSNASYPYAYGYRTPDQVYRTVMAYAPGTRVPYFSNPTLTYQGYVLGIPVGEAGETHNALAINNTRSTTAAYRDATGADFDRNGALTPSDVAAFINEWSESLSQGTLEGDFDGNGQVQPADVALFVSVWSAALSAGC